MTEQELVDRCRTGDEKAQKELFYHFRRYVFGICNRYTTSEDEAKDLAQETFIKVYKSIHQLQDSSHVRGWIRRIAVNHCITYYHKRVRFEHDEIAEGLEVVDENYQDVFSDLSTEDILRLINKLPDGYRLVFNMYVIEGYSHEEIGQLLGISEVTSRTQLFKARKILKRQLTSNQHGITKFI